MEQLKYTFDPTTDYNHVGLGLTLGDLKEIHNALLDLETLSGGEKSFDRATVKLSMIIEDENFSNKHDLPF